MTISWVWNINSSTRFQGNVFASLTRTSNPYYTLLNSKGISPDQMNMSKIESEQSHYQKSVEQTSPGHVPTFLTSRWSNLPVVEERVNGRVKQNWGNVIHSSSLLIYIQRSFSVGHPGLLDTILLLWEGWRCSKHVLSAEGVWGRAGITCGEDSACQVIPAPLGQQWPAAAGRQKASNTGYKSSLCWNRGSPQNGTHGEILVPQAESCHQKQRALGFYRAPTSCEYQGPGGLFWLFCWPFSINPKLSLFLSSSLMFTFRV